MQDLLALIKENVRQIAADAAVIRENYAAMNTMADDLLAAIEKRGRREFSLFTPREGRQS